VSVASHDPVSGGSIFVQASDPNPGRRVFLCFSEGLADGGFVCADQSLITANNGHDRDGLRRRKCHVIERTSLALFRASLGNAHPRCGAAGEIRPSVVKTLSHWLQESWRCDLPFELQAVQRRVPASGLSTFRFWS